MSDNSISKPKHTDQPHDLSAQIADEIRASIVRGELVADDRLPSEAELSESYGVSRPTVREALKRLAAQSLIRTRRGATGGAFVNRQSFEDAYRQMATTATLLLSLNDVDFATACEARFALERGCMRLAAKHRDEAHLAIMRQEIARQQQADLSDEAFCASDVAFHRALVDAAGNPVLSWQLAAAVEGIEPLMNMITYKQRDREAVVALHEAILEALESRIGARLEILIDYLRDQTLRTALAARDACQKDHEA
ncbi:FadR/GntR family transcriptional regulator [Celeribacter neptunius]|uniref:Transcriptional regulator, GntR family n=1 Tax=Celeribacter neptunius TaxID=588602 RepID=A0A1I3KPA5_9RHOB|nr:FadR/GntR family transcriptional regulator [Celeribacter neptunius]SFI74343.1 transcriptional regulator, GntR family [Celeribacter neptunius]